MINEPLAINIVEEGLTVDWGGGHLSIFGHRMLRGECRCAKCINEWTGQRILDVKALPHDIHALDYIELGRYAIQILWSDAHETGIYSFELLKSLCNCALCDAKRP